MKTEHGDSSTFAGVLDPGRGRTGPALLKVRLAFLRDAFDEVCRFSGEEFEFSSIHRRVLKISSGRHLSEKQAIFSDVTAIYIVYILN